MNQRYTALPVIALGLKACAYILLVASVIMSIVRLIIGISDLLGFWQGHLVPACQGLFYGIVSWLVLLGFSEGIHVLLDIEENTRRTADMSGGPPKGTMGN